MLASRSIRCWSYDLRQSGGGRTWPSSAALHREMTAWGRGCKACLSECGDSSPLLLAATRRGVPRAGDESPAAKSGSELPHSENDATDQSTGV